MKFFQLHHYLKTIPLIVLLMFCTTLSAQVRLESICTLNGHKEVRLTGMGLVVGLDG
ncbi:MAG TPA: flagellar biosynthesis protein FlgA, partial [Planctomycetaceae bacterium]|nr:flagellar biosynthesis protein FlgA [Planctomycetaceae bacterium]